MKIAVFNGSNKKGCTWNLKNDFIKGLGEGHEITEFFIPKDLPVFCKGCATCVLRGIEFCPHAEYLKPIMTAIEQADLLVFTSPVYVFHVTGALKNMFDHLFVYWMSHRPEACMQNKQAVVITDCLGVGNKSTAKPINDSLDYWGVGKRYNAGFKLINTIFWDEVPDKRKAKFKKKNAKLAKKVLKESGDVRPRFKIKLLFRVFTKSQKIISKKYNTTDGLDYKHWKENGWLDGKKPWKNKI